MHLSLHRMYTDVLDVQAGDHDMDPIQSLISDQADPIFIVDKRTGRVTRTNRDEDDGNVELSPIGQPLEEQVWFAEEYSGKAHAFYRGRWYLSEKKDVILDGSEQMIFTLKERPDLPDIRSMKILKQMTATLLHRLRSPLNGSQGYLELLEQDMTSDRASRQYRKVQEGLDQAFDIMDELELLNQAAPVREPDETEHRAVPEEIVQNLKVQFTQHHAGRIRFTSYSDSRQMLCRPEMLREILCELIRNGLEHTDEGEILITFDSPDCIRVTNSGKPIPDDIAGKIFHPFITQKVSNLGVGLTRIQMLANSQRGTLILTENSPGNGITFTFRLPPPGW